MHNFIFLVLRARQIVICHNKEKVFNCDRFRRHSEVQVATDNLLPFVSIGQSVAFLKRKHILVVNED
jgi:hypothetical protein